MIGVLQYRLSSRSLRPEYGDITSRACRIASNFHPPEGVFWPTLASVRRKTRKSLRVPNGG